MVDAACRGATGLFYPVRGESQDAAKQVCFGCPVRARCLNYAMEHREVHGIWGGWSERQRRQIRGDKTKRLMVRIAAETEALNDRKVAS